MKKNKINRQKLAIERIEKNILDYQDRIKKLNKGDEMFKELSSKLKKANQTIENTLKNMGKKY
jgi:exonuclease VII small subunit